MRIIAGSHKGKRLFTPADSTIRPTTDRIRETLFNILVNNRWVQDAVVLDAFCGTGALGLEAISRGASKAYMMDIAKESLALSRKNIKHMNVEDQCQVILADARHPPKASESADLVFLDPPYGKNLLIDVLPELAKQGWLAEGCICIIEQTKKFPETIPANFKLLDKRKIGDTEIFITKLC